MHVTPIENTDALDRLRETWNTLARGVPFRSWEWLVQWWRHYGSTDRQWVLTLQDDAHQILGIAPWYVTSSRSRGRVIKLLGTGEVCSDYLTILAAPGREDDIADALAAYLCEGAATDGTAGHRWDTLELCGIDAGNRIVGRLAERLGDRGFSVGCRHAHRCWRIELPNTWDDYLAAHSKSHRKQLRRLRRQWFDTGRAVLHRVDREDQLARAWELLVALHTERRASLGQQGCFASERFARFHRQMASEFLAAGVLRLFWLELDGRPVAAEYQLAAGGVTYAYQSGVDPARLDVQPGQLITMATIGEAIAEGQRTFDFLRGDEPYKAHWRARPRANCDWRIVAPRPVARLRSGIQSAAEGVKGWLQSGLAMVGGGNG